MTYLFCYDITDTHRRNRVAMALDRFGLRVQKSVFQCDLPQAEADRLKAFLLTIVLEDEDSLFFYPVCTDCFGKVHLLGDQVLSSPNASFEVL
ncbi:MAG: CRISPR-associated endonuclease Cas2 [Treponema sp.]|nr:CRISPR-associated endonuclease Cas2 [Treponema sp.]